MALENISSNDNNNVNTHKHTQKAKGRKERKFVHCTDTMARTHSFTHQPLPPRSPEKANNGNGDFFSLSSSDSHIQTLTKAYKQKHPSSEQHTVHYGR